MNEIIYKQIGVIHSPFKEPQGTPIQSKVALGVEATIEIFPEYSDGLKDLEDYSHIFLVYHFHLSKKMTLHQKPFLDDQERGVFAIRSPSRPNPIGISIVKLVHIRNNILTIRGVDIIDGTPLLDIKPYVPEFDVHEVERIGWLESKIRKLIDMRDDGRFSRKRES